MAIPQVGAAWELELDPITKLVLLRYAWHACEVCGLAWPGVKTLTEKTGLGATAVRKHVDALEHAGWLRLHAYPKGGRGRSTQYVVLPGLPGLSTAPCAKCQWNLSNPSPRGGFATMSGDKGTATRSLSGKPTAPEAKTHRAGDPVPVSEVIAGLGVPAKPGAAGGA